MPIEHLFRARCDMCLVNQIEFYIEKGTDPEPYLPKGWGHGGCLGVVRNPEDPAFNPIKMAPIICPNCNKRSKELVEGLRRGGP